MDESLLKAFFSLAACVVSLLVVYYFVKKYATRKGKVASEDGASFSIISRQPLPPKGMIYLVGIGGRRLLIGATEHNVSLLADITGNDSPAASPALASRMAQSFPAEQSPAAGFRQNAPNPLTDVDTDADSVSFSAFLKTVLSREHPTRK